MDYFEVFILYNFFLIYSKCLNKSDGERVKFQDAYCRHCKPFSEYFVEKKRKADSSSICVSIPVLMSTISSSFSTEMV